MRANCCAKSVPVVLAGDYNVAPTDIDIYPTTSWDDDALVQPREPRRLREARQAGLDRRASAELHPDERIYTFWHYLRNRWQRNAGLRLDHFLLSPAIASRLRDAGVDRGDPGTRRRQRSRAGVDRTRPAEMATA